MPFCVFYSARRLAWLKEAGRRQRDCSTCVLTPSPWHAWLQIDRLGARDACRPYGHMAIYGRWHPESFAFLKNFFKEVGTEAKAIFRELVAEVSTLLQRRTARSVRALTMRSLMIAPASQDGQPGPLPKPAGDLRAFFGTAAAQGPALVGPADLSMRSKRVQARAHPGASIGRLAFP